jgi:glyoxylase-like metal-dependent hydrolase (beta-lactamase superfamily II)
MKNGGLNRGMCLLLSLASALGALSGARAYAAAPTPVREIIQVTERLYRFRETRHYGVFLVTSGGIVVVDPISTGVATWLKQELERRFTQPVRYVVYSHAHSDHASGGAVFKDTATLVGHAAMLNNMQRPAASAPLSTREKLWDSNGDGLIQQNEARGTYYEADFKRWDRDGNGGLNRQEIWAARFEGEVQTPDITYTDKASLRLGEVTVELIHLTRNHTDDMTLLWFPSERAIYTADFLTPNRLPRTDLDGGFLPGWVESLREVEQVDFDIIVPAHEAPGTKAQVTEQRRYLEDLVAAVEKAMQAGLTLEQTIKSVLMEKYQHLLEFEMSRAANVRGVYEILQTQRP